MAAPKLEPVAGGKGTDEIIDRLRQEHGEIAVFRTRHGPLVLKTPAQADFQRFTDAVTADKASKYITMRVFVLSCVVYPEREAAEALFMKLPALVPSCAVECQKLAGSEVEAEVSKSP